MLTMPIYTRNGKNLSNGLDMLIMIKFSDRQNPHDPAKRTAGFPQIYDAFKNCWLRSIVTPNMRFRGSQLFVYDCMIL